MAIVSSLYILFLVEVIYTSAQTTFVLKGSETKSAVVKENILLECYVKLQLNQGLLLNVNVPYTLTWSFKPLTIHPNITQSRSNTLKVYQVTSDSIGNLVVEFLSDPSKYSNISSLNLTIKNASFLDAGYYTCSTNITTGNKTSEVRVVESPVCHYNSKDKGLILGKDPSASFNCSTNYAGSKAPDIFWYHRQTNLSNYTKFLSSKGYVRSELTLPLTQSRSGHVFTCRVMYPPHRMLTCHSNPPLKILYPVDITSVHVDPLSSKLSYKQDVRLTLHCSSKGNPPPSYTWKFYPTNGDPPQIVVQSSKYIIDKFKKSKAGTYSCHVNNTVDGTQQTNTKNITISFIDEGDNKEVSYIVPGNTNAHPGIIPDTSPSVPVNTTNNTTSTIDLNTTQTNILLSPYAIAAIISASLALILIIIFICLAIRVKSKERKVRDKLMRTYDETLDGQEVELLDENIQPFTTETPTQYFQTSHNLEIPRQNIRLMEQIGKGSFVEVWKGRVRLGNKASDVSKVAVRKLMSDASDKDKKFFTAELEVLKMLPPHSNVLRLIGCYSAKLQMNISGMGLRGGYIFLGFSKFPTPADPRNKPWLMIMEFAGHGTLLQYLQHHRPGNEGIQIRSQTQSVQLKTNSLSPSQLLVIAAELASGMDHLNKFRLIYYRLKASHILVGKGARIKLTGFGFSHDITERNLYDCNEAPIRWAAPESISEKIFTMKSDVWSFGVLLWEIVHFGMTPYPGLVPQEVFEKVSNGYRMTHPVHCSKTLYNIMLSCWRYDPENRPQFCDLNRRLSEMTSNGSDHIQYDKLPEYYSENTAQA